MSDSRTTDRKSGTIGDTTNKVATYPLTEDDGWADAVTVGGIEPGDFAAVLMVAGRSSFTPEAITGEPSPQKVEAIDIVKRALTGSYANVEELGDAVWDEITEAWCAACATCRALWGERQEEDARRFASFDAQPDDAEVSEGGFCESHESSDDSDPGIVLLVAAVNDPRYPAGACFMKTWDGNARDRHLNDRVVEFSAPREAEEVAIGDEFTDEGLRGLIAEKFRAVARPDSGGSDLDMAASPGIGGPIRTIVLDPTAGFRWLQSFDLEARDR